jgi:hypothetical protein
MSHSALLILPSLSLLDSASSSYQPIPWIMKLVDFIRDLVTDERKSAIKIIGICFGMQVSRRGCFNDICIEGDVGVGRKV